MRKFEDQDYEAFSKVEEKEERRNGKMGKKKLVKKGEKRQKQAVAKVTRTASKPSVEKDAFGFSKGSHSSEAVKLLAAGKITMKDVRKKFPMLSFSKLLKYVEGRGFKVKKNGDGKCSITGNMKQRGGVNGEREKIESREAERTESKDKEAVGSPG